MRARCVLFATLGSLAACAAPGAPQHRAAPAPVPADDPLAAVAFLTGSWVDERGDARDEELWTAPRGGLMLGLNRSLRGGEAVFFEFLRIERRGDQIVYVASPRGETAVEFVLDRAASEEGVVVFTNPEHDFPKRIGYRSGKDGVLRAWIDDGVEGGRRREFGWRREL